MEFLSTQQVYVHLLNALIQSIAPVLMFTAQEAFELTPLTMFEDNNKPLTVF